MQLSHFFIATKTCPSYDITPILGSSAGYREIRSHNRMIGSHWD